MDNQTSDKFALETALVKSLLSDHKASRRWKNIRFFTWIILWAILLIALLYSPSEPQEKPGFGKSYVSLLRLDGVIMPNSQFSATKVLPELSQAFRDKSAKGVVLLINSPGGSPVQASIIHDKIEQLKKKYKKTVIVVAEDTLASGSYLVATAADKIFVNKDTVTGSIGVIMEGFGFTDAIAKLGITRRVFTAGQNKDRMDPFVAMKPADREKIDGILNAVHQDFIADVIAGRGAKLSGDKKELFSGDFWTGTQAVKLGLADGTANPWQAMQETFGTTYYRDYTPRPSFWETVAKDIAMEMHLALPSGVRLQEVG
ncbi:MAG TPA: S49 family peptidase [Coxiellaceae bacterium]|nr:S49 family peptidase [Coxiellaceae bacterium]